MNEEIYIGDGVYLRSDQGGGVQLRTEGGGCFIVLEPSVLDTFLDLVVSWRAMRGGAN